MIFILYILTILVISAQVGAVIMEFKKQTVKTLMVIIHGKEVHVHDNINSIEVGI